MWVSMSCPLTHNGLSTLHFCLQAQRLSELLEPSIIGICYRFAMHQVDHTFPVTCSCLDWGTLSFASFSRFPFLGMAPPPFQARRRCPRGRYHFFLPEFSVSQSRSGFFFGLRSLFLFPHCGAPVLRSHPAAVLAFRILHELRPHGSLSNSTLICFHTFDPFLI